MSHRYETIITFHGLGEPPPGTSEAQRRVWVPVQWLETLIEEAPPQGLSFAFDDGNATDVDVALPVLEAHGLSARFFILVGHLDKPGYLTAEDVVRLHRSGMKVGSHGIDHRDWCTLDDRELHAETVEARARLSEVIGAPVTEAAPPFGSYDRRVLRFLREAGYERVFTSDGGPDFAGARVMGRTSVGRELPLDYWLEVARSAGSVGPGAVLRAKRLLKRIA